MDYSASIQLKSCLKVYEASRMHKLIKMPMRLLKSKLLKCFTRMLGIQIKVVARTFWGEEMIVVYPEGISTQIYQYGFLDKEEGLTQAMLIYLKPGMVFFDVGAHFGLFSLLGSYLVGRAGQVHAFEPTPNTFEILKINAQRKENIHVRNLGVWSEQKTLTLFDLGIVNSGFNSFFHPRLDEGRKRPLETSAIQVNTISIDEYVNCTGHVPNFVKIDAESSESQILKGMEKTIHKYHPILTMEIGDFNLNGVIKSRDLLRYVRGMGYQVFDFLGCAIVKHENKFEYDSANVLLLPEGAIPTQ